MNRYVPAKSKAKVKKVDPWVRWNEEHPELVCTEAACPHNRQTIERRQGKAWQFLHTMSHGRAAFSARTLADLARVELKEAEAVIQLGVEFKLIMPAGHDRERGPVYSRHAKPQGAKKAPAKARAAQRFGQAAGQLWGS